MSIFLVVLNYDEAVMGNNYNAFIIIIMHKPNSDGIQLILTLKVVYDSKAYYYRIMGDYDDNLMKNRYAS